MGRITNPFAPSDALLVAKGLPMLSEDNDGVVPHSSRCWAWWASATAWRVALRASHAAILQPIKGQLLRIRGRAFVVGGAVIGIEAVVHIREHHDL